MPHVARKSFFDVPYTVFNALGGALGEHLDGAIRQIADKTGQVMTVGYPVGGEPKTDALNVTREYDMFGNHFPTDC
jgi:hypothetical protein